MFVTPFRIIEELDVASAHVLRKFVTEAPRKDQFGLPPLTPALSDDSRVQPRWLTIGIRELVSFDSFKTSHIAREEVHGR